VVDEQGQLGWEMLVAVGEDWRAAEEHVAESAAG
jgi:hypothetical protein